MKNYFIIFVFVFITNADNPFLDLGYFEARVRLGDSFTQKYEPLDATDLTYSDNSLKIAKNILKDPDIEPLIEPFMLDRFPPIHIKSILLSEPINMKNIYIKGISRMHIDNLQIRMNQGTTDSYRSDVAISIPRIDASGEVNSASNFLFIRVPINGTIKLVLHNLKFNVILQSKPVMIGNYESYQYDAVDIVTTIDNVELQLNIKGLPNIIEKHLILVLKKYKKDLGKTITKIVVEQINKRIARFSKKEILDVAAGKTNYATVVDMVKVTLGPNPPEM